MQLPLRELLPNSGLPHCDGLYMLGPGNGTIRRCGLVGVGVALLEEVRHFERELPPSCLRMPVFSFWPSNEGVELTLSSSCLDTAMLPP